MRISAFTALLLCALPALSQQQSFTPNPAMSYPGESPQLSVNADKSITFRLAWPEARKVDVQLEGVEKPIAMTQDGSGVWSVTVPPQKPNIYGYEYIVDGHYVADPTNRWYKDSLLYQGNILEVDGDKPMPWDLQPVPHGMVTHHQFHSKLMGVDADYYVYTPPGFDARAKTRYPVLYLLHGFSDAASGWTAMGRADMILDNAIATGSATKMIVVMPLGYGAPDILKQGGRNIPGLGVKNRVKFIESLQTELMPQIEREYPVMTGADKTAIAGLSMGGGESLYAAASQPRMFGYVGAFSPGIFDEYANYADGFKAPRRLLYISSGNRDFLVGPAVEKFRAFLTQNNVTYVWVPQQGNHEWPLWRESLADFVTRVFK